MSLAVAPLALAVHAAPALARPAAAAGLLPALSGRGRAGGVALTFDDGPDPHGTPAVLDALAGLGWSATFFVLGRQVDAHPELARSIYQQGHELAVHGWAHDNHLARTPGATGQDVRRAHTSIRTAVPGARLRYFRPPYGVLTGGGWHAARALKLQPVLWTTLGRDWLPSDGPTVARTVLLRLRDRGTVLLHDADGTSTPGSWHATVASLPLLASALSERRLVVRTLSDHLHAGAAPC